MISSQVWDTHLKWWALIVCIAIGVFFTLPVGMLTAITNNEAGLNVITEMIVGYMTPGRPVAMMLFKSYGYMMTYNCLQYVMDMKLGHYMKVPPRALFRAQFFPVIWLAIVQIAVYNFLRGNIDGICTTTQAQGLTCPNAKTFYNASVIWGVIVSCYPTLHPARPSSRSWPVTDSICNTHRAPEGCSAPAPSSRGSTGSG